ncbi:MAG: polysaccharide deacetylase family protein [Candidatus Komeilibacteria bacterium]|nr:polysaccharide deacetylase family protein [Candidatus Komeilibacteria bacterium]
MSNLPNTRAKKITILGLIIINLIIWTAGFCLAQPFFQKTTKPLTIKLTPAAITNKTPANLLELPTTRPTTLNPKLTNAKEIPIINVAPIQETWDEVKKKMTIEPKEFERQLVTLNKLHFTTYFVKDLPELLTNYPTSAHPIILTFDDGYKNFYLDVYPLLQKYQMKATYYIINNLINHPDYISTNQLIELSQSPLIEIGAHTLDHPHLSTLPTEKVKIEIERSKDELEKLLHQPILTFAYPYGDFNTTTLAIVKQAGFVAAVSTKYGILQSLDNIFSLHRLRSGALMASDSYLTKLFN